MTTKGDTVTYHQPGSAGTASDQYRVTEPDHDYAPERAEYGRRATCARCGCEHLVEPRRATA